MCAAISNWKQAHASRTDNLSKMLVRSMLGRRFVDRHQTGLISNIINGRSNDVKQIGKIGNLATHKPADWYVYYVLRRILSKEQYCRTTANLMGARQSTIPIVIPRHYKRKKYVSGSEICQCQRAMPSAPLVGCSTTYYLQAGSHHLQDAFYSHSGLPVKPYPWLHTLKYFWDFPINCYCQHLTWRWRCQRKPSASALLRSGTQCCHSTIARLSSPAHSDEAC